MFCRNGHPKPEPGPCPVCHRAQQAEYQRTPKGRATALRYRRSDKGRAAAERWNESEGRRQASLRYFDRMPFKRRAERGLRERHRIALHRAAERRHDDGPL